MNVIWDRKHLVFLRIGIVVCKIGTGLFCQMLSSLMQRQLLFWMLQMHQKVNDTFIFCYFPKIFFFISALCYVAFDFVFSYNMAKNVRIYIVLNKINGVTKRYWVYFIGQRKQLFSRVCDRKKTYINYLKMSNRFEVRTIQSWIWYRSFLLTFCKHLSLTRKKM